MTAGLQLKVNGDRVAIVKGCQLKNSDSGMSRSLSELEPRTLLVKIDGDDRRGQQA